MLILLFYGFCIQRTTFLYLRALFLLFFLYYFVTNEVSKETTGLASRGARPLQRPDFDDARRSPNNKRRGNEHGNVR